MAKSTTKTATTYTVNAPQAQPANSLQLKDTTVRAGKAWRQTNSAVGGNTRAASMAALVAAAEKNGGKLTHPQVLAALAGTLPASATPQSRFKAFVKQGYLVPSK